MQSQGCASLGLGGGFQQPIVNFKDLRGRGLGLTGGSLDAYLTVYNPNGFKLDATRLTYTVAVDNNALGTGVLDSRFTVQNHDSTQVRIPIDFTYAGIGSAARQMMNSGSVPYTVNGDVTAATPVGNFTYLTAVPVASPHSAGRRTRGSSISKELLELKAPVERAILVGAPRQIVLRARVDEQLAGRLTRSGASVAYPR